MFWTAAREILRYAIGSAKKNAWVEAWVFKAEVEVLMDALQRMGVKIQAAGI